MSNRFRALWVVVAAFALLASACGDDSGESSDSGSTVDGPTITIGAQDFGESAILAEIYGQALEAAGYDVAHQAIGGFRDLEVPAFESGDINFAPEYAASMLEFLNDFAGEATSDAAETTEFLRTQAKDIGLAALAPSPALDTNTFVVTQEKADELGLVAISDLTDDLSLGAPQDCETNAFCLPGLADVYGVDLSEGFTALDPGVIADALEGGEVDVGLLFSTSGVIADRGFVVLEDDMTMLAADNIVPVISIELAEAYGSDFPSLVDEVSAALDTETLTELNRRFDIDAEDADAIATSFLEDAGLI